MPDVEYWESFYDASTVVSLLIPQKGTIVAFGTGYGTFTTPVAQNLECISMAKRVGFKNVKTVDISKSAPYHFGVLIYK